MSNKTVSVQGGDQTQLLESAKEALGVLTEPGMMDVDEWKAWQKRTIAQLAAAIAKAEGQI